MGDNAVNRAPINVGQNSRMQNTTNELGLIVSELAGKFSEGQEAFFQEQGLTSLSQLPGTVSSLIKVDTILKSVCMLESPDWKGTGFLVEIPDEGIAFMSAGHLFKDDNNKLPLAIKLDKYKLFFNNSSGDPSVAETCHLGQFGSVRGVIAYNGEKRLFPDNSTSSAKPGEDYSMLFLPEEELTKLGLSHLQLGKGDYLDYKKDEVVAIFGHPGEGVSEGGDKRPLRVSYGKEKKGERGGNFLLYNNDTLMGSSGSPVFGRGGETSGCAYAVKGIHVASIKEGRTNGAQSLRNLHSWMEKVNKK